MSEETLLSELCSICHINPPKYRCPRCSVRTCSLPCTRKHKTWSQCSGVRDPAAYATRTQLENPASFDRDYNFITGIERGLERAEREAEKRGIELEHEYMLSTAAANKKRKKQGGGDGSRLVKGELAFVRAAEAAGVRLVRAPRGLTRQKENRSRVHPKQKCLSWSVEWIVASTGQTIIRPCLENIPLFEAYDRVFPRVKDDDTTTATATDAPTENTENEEQTPTTTSHRNVNFYLHRQRTTTNDSIVLAPLKPAVTLREVLRGRSVLEFPTIYVLQQDHVLGEEADAEEQKSRFVLEEVYLRDHPDEDEQEVEEEEEEEEDYTSSEGSSSDETSDDGDGDDDDGEVDDEVGEVEVEVDEELGEEQQITTSSLTT